MVPPSSRRSRIRRTSRSPRCSLFPWRREAQGDGGLGARLTAAFAREFDRGAPAVIAVGSDHPALPRVLLSEALAHIAGGGAAAAIPADDGGYCAIAFSASAPFEDALREVPGPPGPARRDAKPARGPRCFAGAARGRLRRGPAGGRGSAPARPRPAGSRGARLPAGDGASSRGAAVIPVLGSRQMRAADAAAIRSGTPSRTLMENAASALVEETLASFPDWRRVVVVCGPGNNGGDGLAAARLLRESGLSVSIFCLNDPSEYRGDPAENLARARRRPESRRRLFRRPAASSASAGRLPKRTASWMRCSAPGCRGRFPEERPARGRRDRRIR